MSLYSKLNTASTCCFGIGVFFWEIRSIPVFALASLFFSLSVIFTLSAYGFWCITTFLQPPEDEVTRTDLWTGVNFIQEELRYAVAMGFLATICAIIAISSPVFALASGLFYVASDVFICVAEYHKVIALHDAPKSESSTVILQFNRFLYNLSRSSINLTITAASIFIYCFPLYTMPIIFAAAPIVLIALPLTIKFWIDSYLKASPEESTPISVRSTYNETPRPASPGLTLNYTFEQAPAQITSTRRHSDSEIYYDPKLFTRTASDSSITTSSNLELA